MSLSGQLVVLQLGIVLVVVLAFAASSVAQSSVSFTRAEGRRMLSAAETLADTSVVVRGLADPSLSGALPGAGAAQMNNSEATYSIVTDKSGQVVWSPFAEDRRGTLAELDVGQARQWVGEARRHGADVVEARVPVLSDTRPVGEVLGFVVVGTETPSLMSRLAQTTPTLLLYVVIAGLLGVIGSLLLARRVKRQTLGLEPDEITRLVEHRESMLHGLKEGVVGVDPQGTVTLLNDEACRLPALSPDTVGRQLADLPIHPDLAGLLGGSEAGHERVMPVGGRMLVLNRQPLRIRGRSVGWVTTLRDRTELLDLRRELDVARGMTDALRSQAHEFSNRLHTIAGLVELEEYDEVLRFIEVASRNHQDLVRHVSANIHDSAVAALLVAKASRADELSVGFEVAAESSLERVDDALSADLVTVIGNLVDNALEAVAPQGGDVTVSVGTADGGILVRVEDTGPGVDPELAHRVFVQGVSTKPDDTEAHGWGLALTRLVCQRRGGQVEMAPGDGAAFEARLPLVKEEAR